MNIEVQNSRQVASQKSREGFRAQGTGFSDLMQSLSDSKPTKTVQTKEARISNAVMTSAQKYNLPPALVLGVIKQESGFKPQVESHCGAQGLMQLMPGTAKHLGVKDSFSIEQNIEGGCKYLRQMVDRFDGNVKHALAAYNAGPGNVEKYKGIPPFAETKNYVKSVVAHAEKFQGGKLDIPAVKETEEVKSALVDQAQAPQCNPDTSITLADNSMSRQEVQEAISMIMLSSKQPEVRMPERSKSDLTEEPPPPPPSYARRV